LQQNPAIEVNVVDPILRKGYRFKGTATVYAAGDFFEQGIAFYRKRGSLNSINSIVLVKVEKAEPLISPAYDLGRTEAEVRAQWQEHFATLNSAGPDS
jgi:hypothetical protein